ADLLLDVDHHHRAHPDLHPAASRRAYLRADGVHRRLSADRVAVDLAYVGAAALLCVHAARRLGEGESAGASVEADVPPAAATDAQTPGHSGRIVGSCARGESRDCPAARQRISTRTERGRDLGQLDAASGNFGERSLPYAASRARGAALV